MIETLVTFLCPARGRPSLLQSSVDTIYETWAETGPFQVLVYLDLDDPEEPKYGPYPGVEYVRGPRFGYPRLHEAIGKHLVPQARGRWLFLWNDDSFMRTPGWDVVLNETEPDMVLSPDSNRSHETGINTFPVVPKKWVDVAGWSRNGANDTWWQAVGTMINRHKNIPIVVEHTPTDSRTRGYNPATFYSMENYAKMGVAAGRIHQAFYAA